MYLQTLMLLLVEHGLDSCAQECWAVYHRTVNDYLQSEPGMMLFCGMSIGYADPNAAINQWVSERVPLVDFAQFRGI
jgi:nitroreductase